MSVLHHRQQRPHLIFRHAARQGQIVIDATLQWVPYFQQPRLFLPRRFDRLAQASQRLVVRKLFVVRRHRASKYLTQPIARRSRFRKHRLSLFLSNLDDQRRASTTVFPRIRPSARERVRRARHAPRRRRRPHLHLSFRHRAREIVRQKLLRDQPLSYDLSSERSHLRRASRRQPSLPTAGASRDARRLHLRPHAREPTQPLFVRRGRQ
mmetsp:Transcript_6923/g.27854  ORF Transcript_6923/g.27854 Transcript_6923/m.27854 type:complete len:209 (+) Transcript_6923:2352-2978(+)